MQNKFPYWVFEKAVPHNICDLIVEEGLNKTLAEATYLVKGEAHGEEEIRKTNVSWFTENWVLGIMRHHIDIANANCFKLETTNDYIENVQFTVYDKDGHYHWHNDAIDYDDHPTPRKLSAILMLSNPDEYEGGKLELLDGFDPKTQAALGSEITEISQKGAMVVFPATTFHRVTPVTSGRRITLVNWTHGPSLV